MGRGVLDYQDQLKNTIAVSMPYPDPNIPYS